MALFQAFRPLAPSEPEFLSDLLRESMYLRLYKDIAFDLQDTLRAMSRLTRTEQSAFMLLVRRLAESSVNRLLASEAIDTYLNNNTLQFQPLEYMEYTD
jgi:hypothetical protein